MEEIYPTVTIKVIGETAPFRYEVSLKDAPNVDAPTSQAADIRTGTYDTIKEVIACFEWDIPDGVQESIRENLLSARGMEFNLKDAYSMPEWRKAGRARKEDSPPPLRGASCDMSFLRPTHAIKPHGWGTRALRRYKSRFPSGMTNKKTDALLHE